ncbi:uncharacterized protein [Amphiura filiformis]|uniref:uncharacterized protein n=1 Tax=Amphiura filiformis TaxID=82378 RepID=UPI003B20F395
MLSNLKTGTNQISVFASDFRPGSTAQCSFTYERTGSVVLTSTESSEEVVSSTQVPSTSQSPSYKVPSDPGNTLASNQMIIIYSGAGGGALLLIIIVILLVCIVKRNSERKRQRHRAQEQPESIPTSTRPTSLLDRTSEDPTAENMYQETALHASPNQSNQRNGQEPDLSYAYASVSINPSEDRHDPEWPPKESYEYATVTKNRSEMHNTSPNHSDERNRNEETPSTSRGRGAEITYDYASVPINRPKLGEPQSNQSEHIQGTRGGSGHPPEGTYSYATLPIHRPNGSEQKPVIGDRGEDEGWMDNSIYDITEGNDADNKNETEGWEENIAYVSSDR